MRQLVIDRINEYLSRGLDEIGIAYFNFAREKEGKELLPEDINKALLLMSDDELIHALEGQVCQDCR